MRVLTNFAALVALGTIGFAVGDLASHPNALGAVGVILLIAAFTFLLSCLHRPAPERAPAALAKPESHERRRRSAAPAGWDAAEAGVARSGRRGVTRGDDDRVDINAATFQELAALPGVGRVAAGRIVGERGSGGPFSTVSDLARVPGFDPEKVRVLAGRTRV